MIASAAVILALATTVIAQSIVYHGNISTKVFHKPSCAYYDCENCTVSFNTRQEAVNAGYTPCKKCHP